jgi:serine/threonine-protein kinase
MSAGEFFDDVAAAIADGRQLDWAEIDSQTIETDQDLVAQLKTLSALRLAIRTSGLPDRPEQESWGHLRILQCIGRGAFGEVYRAWDTRLDREVALKLLRPESVPADRPGSSIVEEGRLLARVRHPNVVTIHGAERIDGRVGLWMEFVKGRTLEQLLRDGKRFGASEVTQVGIELCRAVSAVHAAGLLHRDIKAHNVMVADDDGRLVLMDFGAGRQLDRTEKHAAGTPLYLSPEVLSGRPATAASEVYSIGVLLYHLLTGSYPVEAGDLADLRRAHAQGERANLRSTRPDVPQHLARAIERAIDPEPDRRFESVDAFGAALAASRSAPRLRAAYAAAAAVAIAAIVWIVWSPGAPAAVTPAIVVLPFTNHGSAPESEDFVDGLTDEIIRNLAVIDGLQVKSQTSSFFFKDKPRNLREVDEQLRASHAVEGSVQVDGERLRITARLVQVSGDVVLWSDRFDRTRKDIFSIQDEISRAIVNKLRLTLGRGQRRYQTNVEAYDLYLRAQALLTRGYYDNGERAAALLEEVVRKDPSFAPAYAGLAYAYHVLSWQIEPFLGGKGMSSEAGLSRMRPAAQKAMDLDPLLAEAHAAIGLTYAREFDWTNAERSFQQAIDLNPSLTWIHSQHAAGVLVPLGKAQEAERVLVAALQADPLSLDVRRGLAFAQIAAGRYEEALASLQGVFAVDPNFPGASLQLARALTFAGRPVEALAAREKYGSDGIAWLGRAYVMTGRRADVERLAAAQKHPYRQALLYSALGDKDRTFEALDAAMDTFPNRVALLLALPEMAFLRGDERLDALRRKLRLP